MTMAWSWGTTATRVALLAAPGIALADASKAGNCIGLALRSSIVAFLGVPVGVGVAWAAVLTAVEVCLVGESSAVPACWMVVLGRAKALPRERLMTRMCLRETIVTPMMNEEE